MILYLFTFIISFIYFLNLKIFTTQITIDPMGVEKKRRKKAMDIVTVFLNNNNLIRWDGYWGSRKNVQ